MRRTHADCNRMRLIATQKQRKCFALKAFVQADLQQLQGRFPSEACLMSNATSEGKAAKQASEASRPLLGWGGHRWERAGVQGVRRSHRYLLGGTGELQGLHPLPCALCMHTPPH